MSIIEQAAKRLEELRRSGIEVSMPRAETRRDAGKIDEAAPPERPLRVIEPSVDVPASGTGGSARQSGLHPLPARASDEAARRQSRCVDIDLGRLAASGFITPDSPRSQLADEFRVIKRPLLTNVQGKSAARVERANLIMVSSSVPGEGKTFTAINLALSIAMELDNTVLLVDADVSRPSVLERLGLPPSKGLLDVLTDRDLGLAEVLMRTNVEKLTIMPAGTPQSRATELLASDAMNRLVDELATRYSDRILIFDAPPLLPSTESRVLATHMGQVVLVVEAERTPQASVTQALATIEACPVVMTVLNKAPRSQMGDYYGRYGHYGQYGY